MGRRVSAVQAFCSRQNLGAGAIHLPQAFEKGGGPRAAAPHVAEDDPASPQFVVTRRGLGYLFNA